MSHRRFATLSLLLALTSLMPVRCNAQVARDSVGVRIVQNASPATGSSGSMQLATTPRLELRPDQGLQYSFDGIAGVLRLSSEQYVVAERATAQLRLFGADGSYIRTIETRSVSDVQQRPAYSLVRLQGDTVALVDGFEATVIDGASGGMYRIAGRRAGRPGPPRELLYGVLPDAAGVFFELEQSLPTDRSLGTAWTHYRNASLRARDGTVHELGSLPVGTLTMTKDGPRPAWLSPEAIVCAGSGRLFYGFGDSFSINVYSLQGRLTSIFRRDWTPTRVTRVDWDRWVTQWSRRWVTVSGPDSLTQVEAVRASPYARTLPAFAGCLVDQLGRLWVREAHLDDSMTAGSLAHDPVVPSVWSVFSATGQWLSDVSMPAQFQPTDIGADYVAGRARSTGGKALVAVYDLMVRAR